jgi:uncharacterized protein DUF4136
MRFQPKTFRGETVIAPICVRMVLIIMAGISLASCATSLHGTVSAVSYSAPPQPPLFIVISPDSLSLTERSISALIEAKMSKRGYQKAESIESANVGVMYKYSIDPTGSMSSVPDYSTGGQVTYTTYPRHFMIGVIDLQKSKLPEKIEILWQGELYSAGTSRNISLLAPHFIDVLFENYGTTVSNKRFSKVLD